MGRLAGYLQILLRIEEMIDREGVMIDILAIFLLLLGPFRLFCSDHRSRAADKEMPRNRILGRAGRKKK